jgi:hypothetical protein
LQKGKIFQQVIEKMHWILIVLIAVIAIYVFAAINMQLTCEWLPKTWLAEAATHAPPGRVEFSLF